MFPSSCTCSVFVVHIIFHGMGLVLVVSVSASIWCDGEPRSTHDHGEPRSTRGAGEIPAFSWFALRVFFSWRHRLVPTRVGNLIGFGRQRSLCSRVPVFFAYLQPYSYLFHLCCRH